MSSSDNAPALRLYSMEGPVWLPANAPARALYPPESNRRAKVLFLGATATGLTSDPVQAQVAGLLSRAVPLFMAESAYVLLGLDAVTILPWNAERGFALLPQPWKEEDAAAAAGSGGAAVSVVLHVTAQPEAARVHVRLLRPASPSAMHTLAAEWTTDVSWQRPAGALPATWSRLAGHLVALLGDTPAAPDPLRYTLPSGPAFPFYLQALEQVAALRCMSSDADNASLLHGQHPAVRRLLELAQMYPQSLPIRLLLHEALLRMSDMDREYTHGLRAEVLELGSTTAFPEPAVRTVLERQLRLLYAS